MQLSSNKPRRFGKHCTCHLLSEAGSNHAVEKKVMTKVLATTWLEKKVYARHHVQTGFGAHAASCATGTGSSFSRVKHHRMKLDAVV
jgi:hypothetical protein